MNSARIFASRNSIIQWINSTLLTNMSKIQQLGSGIIYCLLLDCAYPGRVPICKLKWYAKTEVQYIHNFKILQGCFIHLGIEKKIEISKLTQAKYQDNLDFIQWMKWFIQGNLSSQYPALKRRLNRQIFYGFCQHQFIRMTTSKSQKKKVSRNSKNLLKPNKEDLLGQYKYKNQFLEIFESKTEESPQLRQKKMMKTFANINIEQWREQKQKTMNKQNKFNNTILINPDMGKINTQCSYASPKEIKRFYFPERFSERLKRRVDVLNSKNNSMQKLDESQQEVETKSENFEAAKFRQYKQGIIQQEKIRVIDFDQ